MLEAFIELQHLSWVFTAGVMQAYKGRAGSSPRALSGTAPAVFGCHMEDHAKHVQSIPLPAMQQNLNYVYPQIFWVDSSANTSTSCPPPPPVAPFPPPVPDRRRKPRDNNRERRSTGFLVISLLILLALTGVGLSMFQIFHLEKQLAELRESASTEHIPPALEKLIGQKEQSMKKEARKAAHLTGNPAQRDLPLEWEPISGHAFTNGIQYRDQGLIINETGLYFVYSNVLFRGSVCSSQLLSHVVYKKNPTLPGSYVLMEDKTINYCMSEKTWARKSYLGALFQLRKMDSLHVNVSKIALVNFEESKTFFGLFKL
ncbi:tumor necrosis factor ligand superfamily member 6 [Numenius arquata]|uniref:tumor necrosis factor ligand superfamily member 6 n=1 Tax=Numenius arquata TaxID=31919 RepID=UPI003D306C36